MERQPVKTEGLRLLGRIEAVADDRMMHGQEMYADLMRPAGPRLGLDEAESLVGLPLFGVDWHGAGPEARPIRLRVAHLAAGTALGGPFRPALEAAPDRPDDGAERLPHLAPDEREVLLGDCPLLELILEEGMGFGRLCDEDGTRRVAIEAMHDAGPVEDLAVGSALYLAYPRQAGIAAHSPVGQEWPLAAAIGMDHQAGGLIHDDAIIVFVDDGHLFQKSAVHSMSIQYGFAICTFHYTLCTVLRP